MGGRRWELIAGRHMAIPGVCSFPQSSVQTQRHQSQELRRSHSGKQEACSTGMQQGMGDYFGWKGKKVAVDKYTCPAPGCRRASAIACFKVLLCVRVTDCSIELENSRARGIQCGGKQYQPVGKCNVLHAVCDLCCLTKNTHSVNERIMHTSVIK